MGSRGRQTSIGAGFNAASPLGFGFLFGVSMPRARCDSLILRQMKVILSQGLCEQLD